MEEKRAEGARSPVDLIREALELLERHASSVGSPVRRFRCAAEIPNVSKLELEFELGAPADHAMKAALAPFVAGAERVKKAKQLLTAGKAYAQGCSGFVCDVLGIDWEDANSLLGSSPTHAGANNSYPTLRPGDVVGWKVDGGSGHVAIYVGEDGQKFIDVRSPNDTPRSVGNGYGPQAVYKSSKY